MSERLKTTIITTKTANQNAPFEPFKRDVYVYIFCNELQYMQGELFSRTACLSSFYSIVFFFDLHKKKKKVHFSLNFYQTNFWKQICEYRMFRVRKSFRTYYLYKI